MYMACMIPAWFPNATSITKYISRIRDTDSNILGEMIRSFQDLSGFSNYNSKTNVTEIVGPLTCFGISRYNALPFRIDRIR